MYKTPGELRAERATADPVVPLSQGDILDDCPLVFWSDQTREAAEGDEPLSLRARVIILTQACDLAHEKAVRAAVAVVHDAVDLVRTGRVKEEFIRDHVRIGKVYGWYYLPAHVTCPGFPESLVDLRDLHTVPLMLLEGNRSRVEGDKRTGTHRAAEILLRCFGRSYRSAQRHPWLLRSIIPKRATRLSVSRLGFFPADSTVR
jgi:hypothetical protein